MIDVRIEIRCNRCHCIIATVTDVGGGLQCVREAIQDARAAAEKKAGPRSTVAVQLATTALLASDR